MTERAGFYRDDQCVDWECVPSGHPSRYPYEPAMCPRSGCGSTTFRLLDPKKAAEARRVDARRGAATPVGYHA